VLWPNTDSASPSDAICSIVNLSPTPAHFVALASAFLTSNGYIELREADIWTDLPQKFFVIREGRSLITANKVDFTSGLVVGSYIDAPCLQMQPNSLRSSGNIDEVRVFPSGRSVWFEWLDRRLSAAGAAVYRSGSAVKFSLFKLTDAIGIIPSLAVHFNRPIGLRPVFDFDKNFKVFLNHSPQSPRSPTGESPLLRERIAAEVGAAPSDLIDYDVTFYDTNPARSALTAD
jgi:aspartyl aminopeptidase